MFTKPHPKRKAMEYKTVLEEPFLPDDPHQSKPSILQTTSQAPLVFIKSLPASNEIVFVHSDGSLTLNDFTPLIRMDRQQERSILRISGYTSSDRIEKDGDRVILFKWKKDPLNTSKQKKLDALFPSFNDTSSNCFAFTSDGKTVISCASTWDTPRGNFKIISTANGSILRNIYYGSGGRTHRDVVSCVSIATDDDTFVTGSLDSTLFLWSLKRLLSTNAAAPLPPPTPIASSAPTPPTSPLPQHAPSPSTSAAPPSTASATTTTPTSPRASPAGPSTPTPSNSGGVVVDVPPPPPPSQVGPTKPFGWERMLCGHTDGVTCVNVSVEHGIVASGGRDRRVLLHRIHSGRLLRSFSDRKEQQLTPEEPDEEGGGSLRKRKKINQSDGSGKGDNNTTATTIMGGGDSARVEEKVALGGVEMVVVSRVSGNVISYYSHPNVVCVHTLNGVLLQQINLEEQSELEGSLLKSCKAMKVMPRRKDDKEFLVLGGEGGVTIRSIPSLQLICQFEVPASTVISMSFIEDSFLFAGLEDGQAAVFPLFIVNVN